MSMTGQKGGHKDRIKTWKIIYRRRKQEKIMLQNQIREKKRLERKKRKELEMQYRLTMRERSLSWFYLIFGLFFGVLERKAGHPKQKTVVITLESGKNISLSKTDGEKIHALEKELLQIEQRVQDVIAVSEQSSKEKIALLKEEIDQKKQTIVGISNIYQNTKKEYQTKVDQPKQILNASELAMQDSLTKPIPMDSMIEKAMSAVSLAETILLKREKSIEEQKQTMEKQFSADEKKAITELNMDDQVVKKSAGISESIEMIEYIKETTEKLKEKSKKIHFLQNEIFDTQDEIRFQLKQQELKYLRDDIFKMQLKWNEMDRVYGFYHYGSETKAYELDQFQLLSNPLIFSKMIVEIDQVLEKKFKKKEVIIDKQQTEEKKEIQKKGNKLENTDFLNEIEQADQVIQEQIDSQKKAIETLKFKLQQPSTIKKRSIFHIRTVGNMVFNVTKLITGFFSFSFFKNKAVGLLTGAFLIHNGVRGLKHALQPEAPMQYYDMTQIKHMLKEQADCISYTRHLLEDSSIELIEVKKSFMEKFMDIQETVEYKNVMNQILKMESDLNARKLELMNHQENLNMEKSKTKKLEKRYHDDH